MCGIIIMIAVITIMSRVAVMGNRSGTVWGLITFFICVLCTFIPLPLVNYAIALVISFIAFAIACMLSENRP